MNSFSETYLINDLKERLPWITFLFVFSIFFISSHNIYYSLMDNFNKPMEDFVQSTSHGNILNVLAYFSFGLMSIFIIFRNGLSRLHLQGPLMWFLIAFIGWSFLSITWSSDPFLTFKRLTAFSIIVLGAVAMNTRFSINLIPRFAFFLAAANLAIGLLAELSLGTFQPFLITYRFSGTVHPNTQGLNCAIMFLATLCLLHDESIGPRVRLLLKIAGLLAFTGLILTKSRTAFASALAAYTIFWLLTAAPSRKYLAISLLVSSCCLVFLLLGDSLLPKLYQAIFLFREDQALEFGGRPFIWKTVLKYVAESPLLGYGYNSFWTVRHIKEISDYIGTGLIDSHSGYIELLLDIGVIGFFLYIVIMFWGIKLSYAGIKKTGQVGFIFHFTLAVFLLIHGTMESAMLHSPGSFFLIWGLLFLASQGFQEAIQGG